MSAAPGGEPGRRPAAAHPASGGPDGTPDAGGGNALEQFIRVTLRQIRRMAILLIGTTVVLVGIVMIVTPGPAVVVVPIGLGILAIEFAWARRLLHQVRDRAMSLREQYRGRKG